jgi:hypothetical protein
MAVAIHKEVWVHPAVGICFEFCPKKVKRRLDPYSASLRPFFFYKTGWPWHGCRNCSCCTSADFYCGWCLKKAIRKPDRRTF